MLVRSFTMNVIIEAGMKANPIENINDETIPSAVLCKLYVLYVSLRGIFVIFRTISLDVASLMAA